MNARGYHNIRLKRTMKLSVVLLLLFSVYATAQQKVQFTQYMFNTLVINPAYAGAEEALSLTFIQRKQWTGLERSPSTQTLSGHTLFKKNNIGLGATIINDRIGVHKNLSLLTNYAYHLTVREKSYLSMGLLAGIHNQRSDYSTLTGYQSNDPKLYNPYIAHTFFDFGAGVYYRSRRFHAGLSAPEILPAKISVNDTLSIRLSSVNYFLFTKYSIPVNANLDAEPSVLVKYLPGLPVSFDLNMNMVFRKVLTMGLSYRKSESVDFLFKGQLTPQLQFGYAYDHPIGNISRISNGSHEIMIHYLFRYVESNVSSPR
jgi:type IX secretion system PorP/SprF family membrane protein